MLQRNEEVLLFEFLRYCSKISSDIVTLASFENCPDIVLISSEAAVSWAVASCSLSDFCAKDILQSVICFSEDSNAITFSQFIIFGIRCFVEKNDSKAETWSSYLSSVKHLIEHCSQKLNSINTILGLNVLDFYLSEDYRKRLNRESLDAIYLAALNVFNCRRTIVRNVKNKNVPPRPPSALWDAPRWMEFLKFIRFINQSSCLHSLWQIFGVYLRDNEFVKNSAKWAKEAVPPNPITISLPHLLALLRIAAKKITSNRNGDELTTLVALTASRAFPAIVLAADGAKTSTVTGPVDLFLEDIFRFGGDNAVSALQRESLFLRDQLIQFSSNQEISLSVLSSSLTIRNAFSSEILHVCIKRSKLLNV